MTPDRPRSSSERAILVLAKAVEARRVPAVRLSVRLSGMRMNAVASAFYADAFSHGPVGIAN